MDIDLGTQMATVFTTLLGPYLSGLALETSTVLGLIVGKIQRPFLRQLFLGIAIFSILFFVGFIPVISDGVDVWIDHINMVQFLGSKAKAYIFLVGIATFVVSFFLLVILSPFNLLLSRKGAEDVRKQPLFQK